MLNRLRGLMKRLELPQELDEQDIVYRIIDEYQNAVEVTPAQYARWRLLNDVSERAIVAQDVIQDVRVYTTLSIMPEDRGYKPFGTSAVNLTTLEPLSLYGQRYDTWQEAEGGHKQVLQRIRSSFEAVTGHESESPAPSFAILAVSRSLDESLASAFQVKASADSLATISTPILLSNGSPISVDVAEAGNGFTLSFTGAASGSLWDVTAGTLDPESSAELFQLFGVTATSKALTSIAETPDQLGVAVIRLAQAVATVSFANAMNGGEE